MNNKKKIVTIPNIISFYRLISFPYIFYLAVNGIEDLFVIFIIINLISDILDGLIARVFRMQTDFGARLDSIADIGTYILAIMGIFLFKADDFEPHLSSFYAFISLFAFSNILSLLKFRRLPSLHLYSWKIGGYIQGAFFFVLFAYGFNVEFYYLMVFWGIAAFLEHITIQLIINEMKSNSKGLYWILSEKRQVNSGQFKKPPTS